MRNKETLIFLCLLHAERPVRMHLRCEVQPTVQARATRLTPRIDELAYLNPRP